MTCAAKGEAGPEPEEKEEEKKNEKDWRDAAASSANATTGYLCLWGGKAVFNAAASSSTAGQNAPYPVSTAAPDAKEEANPNNRAANDNDNRNNNDNKSKTDEIESNLRIGGRKRGVFGSRSSSMQTNKAAIDVRNDGGPDDIKNNSNNNNNKN